MCRRPIQQHKKDSAAIVGLSCQSISNGIA